MLAIYDSFGYELPMEERYRLIKQAGFYGTLLDFDRAGYRDQPHMARQAGLWIENVHTPPQNINSLWLDNQDGEAMTECFLQCVEDCAMFEIHTMVMHLSRGVNPPQINTLGMDRIKRIVALAEKKGVNIALENLTKLEYLDYVLEKIDSPRVGFCYDSGHHNCRTPHTDLLAQYGSRLMTLHLHDNDGYFTGAHDEDQHRLPYDGTIDWTATMQGIAKLNYKGAIALEVVNRGYKHLPAEEFLRIAYERAKRLEMLC